MIEISYENKEMMKMAKEILHINLRSRIKKVKDESDLNDVLRYSLVSALEKEYHHLADKVRELESSGKDILIIQIKLLAIPSKIKLFSATLSRKEFNKVVLLISEIKKEVKDVQSV